MPESEGRRRHNLSRAQSPSRSGARCLGAVPIIASHQRGAFRTYTGTMRLTRGAADLEWEPCGVLVPGMNPQRYRDFAPEAPGVVPFRKG